MRSLILAAIAIFTARAFVAAQSPAPHVLDARASDPGTIGWMAGAPPAPDKMIRFADGSWFKFPQTRWSFSNVRTLMPTSVVGRGAGPVTTLPRAERAGIDALTFQPLFRTDTMTWEQSPGAYTLTFVVLGDPIVHAVQFRVG